MTETILVLNASSSSIKIALLASSKKLAVPCVFKMTGGGSDNEQQRIETPPADDAHDVLTAWLPQALQCGYPDIDISATGHRAVLDGQTYAHPIRGPPNVIKEREQVNPSAPNHQPHNLAAINAIARRWPGLLQVACFAVDFHRSLPWIALLFALPLYRTSLVPKCTARAPT